jgi:hypothetical protein
MNNLIRKQFLCTFSNSKNYTNDVDNIIENFDLIDKRVFIFSNINDACDVYLTFNVEKNKVNLNKKHKNTISIHRKKETNTLYTLNAMNRLIEDENGGIFDKSFKLSWNLYQNSIILKTSIYSQSIKV